MKTFSALALLAAGSIAFAQDSSPDTEGFAGVQFTNPPSGAAFPPGQGFATIISWHSYSQNFELLSAYYKLVSLDGSGGGATFLGNATIGSAEVPQGFVGSSQTVLEIPPGQTAGTYNLTAVIFGYVGASYEPILTTIAEPLVVRTDGGAWTSSTANSKRQREKRQRRAMRLNNA